MDIVKYIFSLKWLSDLIYVIKVTVCVCVLYRRPLQWTYSAQIWHGVPHIPRGGQRIHFVRVPPTPRVGGGQILFYFSDHQMASSYQNHLLCHQWLGLNSLDQIVRFCWFCLSKFNSPFDRFGSHHILLFKLKH